MLSRWQDLILPVSLIASLLVILVPLPVEVMDVLLAGNIALSVIVLLTCIYVKTPLEFNVFPSMLLATTLARLVLNVASTRLILTHGAEGEDAAGGVIKGFGNFVAGDQLVVGIIIFVIIVVIQFVVITKGATRISEVAARFALDGMPGKQMAIDADMNAGIIDEKEAQRRREEIAQNADFYGAMDGASKFVRGDAIAGIIITLVNVIGGFVIGVFQYKMDLAEAAEVFTKLSIGDGLVSQVPAFLISLAAGLLVTRSTQKSDLPVQFFSQILNNPRTLAVAGGFLCILILTSLPKLPLLSIGAGCVGLSIMLTRKGKEEAAKQVEKEKTEQAAAKPAEEQIEDFLKIDPMEIEIGAALIRLASPKYGGDLLPRITAVRQQVAADIGIILPKVRIRDNIRLGENHYRVKIAGNPVASAEAYPGKLLAIDSGMTSGKIPGIETKDPAFQQPAVWIETGLEERARMLNYTPVEPTAVLATHLQELVRRHADELLTRDACKHLIDELKKTSPAVVDELIPGLMKLHDVQQVLQMLLREEVPIKQLSLILETLGDTASKTKDAVYLTEYVRHRLARTLCTRYRDAESRLFVLTLDPALEDKIAAGIDHTERGLFVRTPPATIEKMCDRIAAELPKLTRAGHKPILLVSPQIRAGLKQMTSGNLSRLVVLSFNEITRDTKVEILGIIPDEVAPVKKAA